MDFRKQAFILEAIKSLQMNRSSSGRNNIQKALFFATETAPFKLPYVFELYRQGPHSHDLDSELQQMRNNDAVSARPTGAFGDEYSPAANSTIVESRCPLTGTEKQAIGIVCEFVGKKSVEELERMAAAVWVRSRERITERAQVAQRIHELKPYVPIADAAIADNMVTSRLRLARR